MENNLTDRTREILANDVIALKRDAFQIADDVKTRANVHVDETKKRINDTIDLARNYANSHPFAVLGIGVLLGLLIARRRRR